jgi:hypothetical protein
MFFFQGLFLNESMTIPSVDGLEFFLTVLLLEKIVFQKFDLLS